MWEANLLGKRGHDESKRISDNDTNPCFICLFKDSTIVVDFISEHPRWHPSHCRSCLRLGVTMISLSSVFFHIAFCLRSNLVNGVYFLVDPDLISSLPQSLTYYDEGFKF
jgi:uncharacterized integral membrane protein